MEENGLPVPHHHHLRHQYQLYQHHNRDSQAGIGYLREPHPQNHYGNQIHHGNQNDLHSNGWSRTTLSTQMIEMEQTISQATPVDLGEGQGGAVRPMYILGINMHKMSPGLQMAVCIVGVLIFYLFYGYTQEWIFRVQGFKQFGWYLTLLQFFFYSIFGSFERAIQRESGRRIPLSTYVVIAFLTVATMGLSNTSLGYLNYPTQVIFKSCKLVPVMIGGILIQGKRYKLLNGVAVVLMSVGLVLFNLADLSVEPTINETGVLLISLALCADAIIGNLQEKTLKQYSGSNLEMILYSYSIGMVYILVWVCLSGSLIPAFMFCMKNPQLYLMIAMFSLTGYLGINFVLALVRINGALVAVTVTTFRKTLTVILSFVVFTKPFTLQYLWAGILVLMGILLNVYCKNSAAIDSHLRLVKLRLLFMLCREKRRYSTGEFSV